MDSALRQKLDALPAEPGCYLMKDRRGAVIYVGKAASLRSRVRSYFDAGQGDDRAFVGLLDELLGDLEVIVTRSEKEAVLLENELIKRHRPRFNVRLRDDKDFIVLRLDERHPFPRLEVARARQRKDDGARYFGPYSSASSIRETLRVVNRHFQLRTCSDQVFDHRRRPCILYQIHRCPAPCVYEIPPEQYRQGVEDAVELLEGRESELVPRLRARMAESAAALRFEEAARLRDQIGDVERSLESQRVLMGDLADRDVFGLYREGPDVVIEVLVMRGGKLQDSQAFSFRSGGLLSPLAGGPPDRSRQGREALGSGREPPEDIVLSSDPELLSSFLVLYYEQHPAPDEVLLPLEPANAAALAEVLSDRRGKKMRFLTPQRGAKADLLEVAARNAAQGFRSWRERDERREEALLAITRTLRLARRPRWMECYDISTFQGAVAVGSGASMKDGEPDKANYRRYKVKSTAGQDDFAMLHEVVTRRLKRAVAEGSFPDLLVIDGGKGQLNAALAAARDLGVSVKPVPGNPGEPFVEMVALAKSRLLEAGSLGAARVVRRRGRGGAAAVLADAAEAADRGFVAESARSPERVFLPGRKDPVVLRQNSGELFLLARLRDEAHRFAIAFHRKLHRSRNLTSVLEEIPGVGAVRRKALLGHFGSLRRVKEASVEEIAAVEGFGLAHAWAVFEFFRRAEAAAAKEGEAAEARIDAALAEEAQGG